MGIRGLLCAGLIVLAGHAQAAVTAYVDEAAYLSQLQALGSLPLVESFEGSGWSAARSPSTAPNVTSDGITWTSNNATSQVTTGTGSARTGAWGFYSLPHGDYDQHDPITHDCTVVGACVDGFAGSSSRLLVGVGGWFTSNTQQAKIEILLDGAPVNFGAACEPDQCMITSLHRFIGVIDEAGFSSFEIHETEGSLGDQEFIFADDFSFGTTQGPGVPALSPVSRALLVALLAVCGTWSVGRGRLRRP